MTLEINIFDEFGTVCSDGEAAARFRHLRIDPYTSVAERIELDFAGVRAANSSFCNALVANLISQSSAEITQRLRFRNCRESVRIMLIAAVQLGLTRLESRTGQTQAV